MNLVIQRRIDAVADEHGKSDLLQRRDEAIGETSLVGCVAAKERLEIERRDPMIPVELVALMLGKPNGASFLVQWQNGLTVPVYPASAAVAQPEYPKPDFSG